MIEETIVVLDGWVDLDAISPDDTPALRRWFSTISPESRYQRFLGHVGELSPALWRYLTDVDGHDHVALVARIAGQIVGVGRWIRVVAEPEVAELALLVDDVHQRHGIGRLLRDALIDSARAHGIARLRAYVLPSNRAIRRLLDAPQLARHRDSGNLVEVVLATP